MEKKDLRIVFMGTPEFAVESLKSLVEGGYNVVGVVTAVDKPVGRHQNTLVPSAVKKYAVEHGLPLLQPEKLKADSFVEALRTLRADLQVVVAFRMLPEIVWAMPRFGTLNVHASLLPQYRGAAPINWAVINGETESGVTTFFLRHDIDTGDIAMQRRVAIAPDDTAGDLYDRLMREGASLLVQTVDSIIASTVQSIPQSQLAGGAELRPAPKIFTETCRIDWNAPAAAVCNFIRGLAPHPTAWTEVVHHDAKYTMKIYGARLVPETAGEPVGTFCVSADRKHLLVAADEGYVEILELQLSGKKRMPAAAFLNGFHDAESLRLA
jgi:methionyl-tRNA formyltransferase